MLYVTSDLHGISPDSLYALLEKANFSENDFLFILGDVIDRGRHGIKLLEWIINQPNAELILGNHEAMMLTCRFVLAYTDDNFVSRLNEKQLQLFINWMSNGGMRTLDELQLLNQNSPQTAQGIFSYLTKAPVYKTVSANGRDFILVHSGFENFSSDKKLTDYSEEELIWHRPSIDERYFDNVITIFGHTPTAFFGEEYNGKAIKTETWIDIDTGVANGNSPCLLRLDDLKEFYLD